VRGGAVRGGAGRCGAVRCGAGRGCSRRGGAGHTAGRDDVRLPGEGRRDRLEGRSATRCPLRSAPSISAASAPAVCSPQAWNGPTGPTGRPPRLLASSPPRLLASSPPRLLAGGVARVGRADPTGVVPAREHGLGRVDREIRAQAEHRLDPALRPLGHAQRLGAQLEDRAARDRRRPDAAADAIARLENDHLDARVDEPSGAARPARPAPTASTRMRRRYRVVASGARPAVGSRAPLTSVLLVVTLAEVGTGALERLGPRRLDEPATGGLGGQARRCEGRGRPRAGAGLRCDRTRCRHSGILDCPFRRVKWHSRFFSDPKHLIWDPVIWDPVGPERVDFGARLTRPSARRSRGPRR
jgi:hypothetical protein